MIFLRFERFSTSFQDIDDHEMFEISNFERTCDSRFFHVFFEVICLYVGHSVKNVESRNRFRLKKCLNSLKGKAPAEHDSHRESLD